MSDVCLALIFPGQPKRGVSPGSVTNPSVSPIGSSSENTLEVLEGKRARLRGNRACDACRKMKTKCVVLDSLPCQSCRISQRICCFSSQGVKRERPPNKSDVEKLNSRIQTLERALHILAPDIDLSSLPRTVEQARTMVNSSLSRIPHMALNHPPKPSIVTDKLESVSDMHRILHHMSQLRLTPQDFLTEVTSESIGNVQMPQKWEYVNGSGEPDLGYLINHPQRPIVERCVELHHFRNAANERNFPPPDLAEPLIELYFQKIHPYESMLHELSFKAQYNMDLAQRDCSFRALCYAVFAAASRFSSDYRVAPLTGGLKFEKQAAGALYGAASHSLLTPVSLPCTLFDLQAMAVLSHFLIGACSPLTAWFFLGAFLRRAQVDGVDLCGSRRWETSIMKDQLRKRAFWSLVNRETQLCLALGHPLPVDDETLGRFCEAHECYSLTSAYRIAQQSPNLLKMTPRCMARGAMSILQYKVNFQIRALWSLKVVPDPLTWDWDHSLAKQIVQVIDKSITHEIPPQVRWHPDLKSEVDFVVKAQLKCWALYFQIFFHRHLIRDDPNELKICLAAAAGMLDTIECLKIRGLLELTASSTPNLITPAALIYIYSACIQDSCLSPSERANSWVDLHRCLNILATLAPNTFQAEKLKSSLIHLMNTCMEKTLFSGSKVFGTTLKHETSAIFPIVHNSMTAASSEGAVVNFPSGYLNSVVNMASPVANLPDSGKTESESSVDSTKTVRSFNMTAAQLDFSFFQ